MDLLNTFSSTGSKLIHHFDVVQRIKEKRRLLPISLQIAPTSRCNLNCVFCSNANRDKQEDLDIFALTDFLKEMARLGAKTVEWTGGGDPTMYEDINQAMAYAYQLGYQQGMITNGILVKRAIEPENSGRLKWLRISMNTLDYLEDLDLDLPAFKGTLGFSYVWNERTNDHVLRVLARFVERFHPKYIRVVPDCQATQDEQERNNKVLGHRVSTWGPPYFYQAKHFATPKHCWWCYLKPFILHDGWVYPCSSVVLNSTSDYTFHKQFRWCSMADLHRRYMTAARPLPVQHCDRCVFKGQNDLVEDILHPNGMEDFI